MRPALLDSLVQEPPKEDSENLSDEEIAQAVPVAGPREVGQYLVQEIRKADLLVKKVGHELLRRGDRLYWRVRLGLLDSERVFVFQVNWLGGI